MKSRATKMERALDLVRARGALRPRELKEWGIPLDYLDRLYRRGLVERVGRGLYVWPDAEISEYNSLVEVARLVPGGIVCLLSALRFHELTTQSPRDVWLAIPHKGWMPRIKSPRLRMFRFSGLALTEMVEEHLIEGVVVKVYSPAKTVADCFKHRSKVGLDVALEALRDCYRGRRATMDEIWAAAGIDRVRKIMSPYMESLV